MSLMIQWTWSISQSNFWKRPNRNWALGLQWCTVGAFLRSEKSGSDPGCLPFNGRPGHHDSQIWFPPPKLVRQLFPFLDPQDLATAILAMITSKLNYCNSLYVELPLSLTRILQLVQNAAACLLVPTSMWTQIQPMLPQVHWLPPYSIPHQIQDFGAYL